MSEALYKVTTPIGGAAHGGTGTWSLPLGDPERGWHPGAWWIVPAAPQACVVGLHLVPASQLHRWTDKGLQVWRAEAGAERRAEPNKVVAAAARLLYPVGPILAARLSEREVPAWLRIHDPSRPWGRLVFGFDTLPVAEAEAAVAWHHNAHRLRSNGRWTRQLAKARRERPDLMVAARQGELPEGIPIILIRGAA